MMAYLRQLRRRYIIHKASQRWPYWAPAARAALRENRRDAAEFAKVLGRITRKQGKDQYHGQGKGY